MTSTAPSSFLSGPKQPLLRYINDAPELLSLLYDMDLLPEQCEHGSRDWRNMLLLAEAWKNRQQWPNPSRYVGIRIAVNAITSPWNIYLGITQGSAAETIVGAICALILVADIAHVFWWLRKGTPNDQDQRPLATP